jgi:hypothetical protein
MFKFVRNEANLKKRKYRLQSLEALLKDLNKKTMPHPPFCMERKVGEGLRTTINESIITKILTEKPHPSCLLEKMGGTINNNK